MQGEVRTIRTTAEAIALLDEWQQHATFLEARLRREQHQRECLEMLLNATTTLADRAIQRLVRIEAAK